MWLEKCEKCTGTKINNICNLCQSNTIPVINNNIIELCYFCETGENEKCLTCSSKTYQCSSCNPGYFVPNDVEIKNECQKCSLDKCIKCYGSKDSNICEECAFSYK